MKRLKAPLKSGDQVGTLQIKIDHENTREIPITVSEDVKKSNLLELYIRYLSDIFKGEINL